MRILEARCLVPMLIVEAGWRACFSVLLIFFFRGRQTLGDPVCFQMEFIVFF
jgi:hypothetical protein